MQMQVNCNQDPSSMSPAPLVSSLSELRRLVDDVEENVLKQAQSQAQARAQARAQAQAQARAQAQAQILVILKKK